MNEQISQPILDQNAYEAVRDLLGNDRSGHFLDWLLTRVEAFLKHTCRPGKDPQHLAPEAHDLASASGMFGFLELSEACQVLERASLGTGDLPRALEQFQAAARRALHHDVVLHEHPRRQS